MRFGAPENFFLFFLLPLVAIFLFWAFRKKASLIHKFVSEALRERLLQGVSPFRQKLKAVLLVISLGLMVCALVRPKLGFQWEEVKRKGVDILVAIDVSQSMMAQDVKPNRLERAKREILDLLKIIQGDRIGLIAFAGAAFLQCPLTLDHGAVRLFLDSVDTDLIPVPGTAISEAIRESIRAFSKSAKKSRALILITDGEDHEQDPIEIAKQAAEEGIKVYTVGIGQEGGAPIPERGGSGFKKDRNGDLILTKLDETVLQKVALETGASYVRSVSGDLDLERIYESIQTELEDQEVKSGRRKRYEERYQWPLFFALLLLVFESCIGERPRESKRIVGRLRQAIILLVLLSSPSAFASPREGVQLYKDSNYQDALNKFIEASVNDPENEKLKFNLASTYYKLGKYQESAQLFSALTSSGDKGISEQSFYNLGNVAYRAGKLNESIAFYEKALELDPEDADAKRNLDFVRKELKKRMKEQEKTQQRAQNKQQAKKDPKEEKKEQKDDQKNSDQAKQDEQSGDKKPNPQNGGEDKKGEEKQMAESKGEKGEKKEAKMSEEQANQLLSRVKEKKPKQQIKGSGEYRVEKDW